MNFNGGMLCSRMWSACKWTLSVRSGTFGCWLIRDSITCH